MFRIANIFNLTYKTIRKKLQKNIIAQVNCSKEKRSIKINFSIQKII